MSRFLTTLPSNSGYYNLGTVEAYPTGGSGPTAYGPTSYFGSDPLPARDGDSINNPVELGNLSSGFKTITISNTHGGNTRIQSTFYKFTLTSPRTVQIIQNYSPTSYQSNTNKNTLIAVYRIEDINRRIELPINDAGYVYNETSVVDDDSYSEFDEYLSDYPTKTLNAGTYLLLITNDIRYLQTTYSFTLNAALIDWRFVLEESSFSFNFESVAVPADEFVDFGSVKAVSSTSSSGFPYNSTSGLGYTRDGVSP